MAKSGGLPGHPKKNWGEDMNVNFTSLTKFAEIIPNNLSVFFAEYPNLAGAAEAINQAFDSLLYYHCRPDTQKPSVWAPYMMGFGAYSSWNLAYILTASGHFDSGLADVRRAIEFACFAAKASQDEKKAIAWMEQSDNPEAKQIFISTCTIPRCYTSEKYRFLRQLILAYEYANYYGVHANLKSIVEKYEDDKNVLKHLFQSDPKRYPQASSYITMLGFRLLIAFKNILNSSLAEAMKLEDLLEFVESKITIMRLDLAKMDNKGYLSDEVVNNIFFDKIDFVDQEFEKLIQREKERKSL